MMVWVTPLWNSWLPVMSWARVGAQDGATW
jgi:hypothetical protein